MLNAELKFNSIDYNKNSRIHLLNNSEREQIYKDLVEKILPSYEGIVTHHPAMEWPLIPQFYQNLGEAIVVGTAGPPVAVLAAEFAMLSVLRYQNVAGLRWEWINEAERYIAIPRALTKMRKPHVAMALRDYLKDAE